MGCKKRIYNEKMTDIIKKHGYMPIKVGYTEKLRQFHKYWLNESSELFKVEEVYQVEKEEYYSVKYYGDSILYGALSAPLKRNDTYEMIKDNIFLASENIIDCGKSYSGSQIKYWLTINDIDFDDDEFGSLWSFVNPLSKSYISDYKFYYLVKGKRKPGDIKDHYIVKVDSTKEFTITDAGKRVITRKR